MIANFKTNFTVDAKDDKKCDKINAELEKMENMKTRCEKSRDDGNQGGSGVTPGVHGSSETCWPRMKDYLPKYIEHLKKLHAENKCKPKEKKEHPDLSGYGL